MTNAELAELLRDCPTLYHMAERGSWPSIKRHGLLSTSALLDRSGVAGMARAAVEDSRRPEKVSLHAADLGRVVVRDQKPMDDAGLKRCLQDSLTPRDWYRLLNGKVFFWLTLDRLHRLLGAGPYRDAEHDVLEIDASALITAYRDKITLCAINSGNTKPFPAKRGKTTLLPIDDYPYAMWRHMRRKGERVVELAVTAGVPDLISFVQRVTIRREHDILSVLYSRDSQMPVNNQSNSRTMSSR